MSNSVVYKRLSGASADVRAKVITYEKTCRERWGDVLPYLLSKSDHLSTLAFKGDWEGVHTHLDSIVPINWQTGNHLREVIDIFHEGPISNVVHVGNAAFYSEGAKLLVKDLSAKGYTSCREVFTFEAPITGLALNQDHVVCITADNKVHSALPEVLKSRKESVPDLKDPLPSSAPITAMPTGPFKSIALDTKPELVDIRGSWLAIASSNKVSIIDLENPSTPAQHLAIDGPSCIALTDKTLFVGRENGKVQILGNYKTPLNSQPQTIACHSGPISHIANHNNLMVTTSGTHVKMWKLGHSLEPLSEPVKLYGHDTPVQDLRLLIPPKGDELSVKIVTVGNSVRVFGNGQHLYSIAHEKSSQLSVSEFDILVLDKDSRVQRIDFTPTLKDERGFSVSEVVSSLQFSLFNTRAVSQFKAWWFQ